jgi:tRNA(Ile)-lysidine synthase
LLTKFCADHGNAFLCTAHHQDDQIETFLSRLCRGSGVYGLSGMSARQMHNGISILRPFLQFEKSRLTATLVTANQNWIDDPSNDNDRFTRVKLRQLRGTFADLGLDTHRLLRTIDRMQSARSVIERQVKICSSESVNWSLFGFCQIDGATLTKYDQEIALRVLGECLASIGGGDYTPRYDSLYELYIGLSGGGEISARTLGGCIIESTGSVITICREHQAIAIKTAIGDKMIWDGRFEVRADGMPDNIDCFIAPLGMDGWRDIVQSRPDLRDIRMPIHAKYALPAIKMRREGVDETLAAPHLNYWKDQIIQSNWSALSINFRPRHHKDAFGLHI